MIIDTDKLGITSLKVISIILSVNAIIWIIAYLL